MNNKKRIRKLVKKLQSKELKFKVFSEHTIGFDFRMPEIKTCSGVVHEAVIIQYPSLTPEESERLKMQLENIRILGRSKV